MSMYVIVIVIVINVLFAAHTHVLDQGVANLQRSRLVHPVLLMLSAFAMSPKCPMHLCKTDR